MLGLLLWHVAGEIGGDGLFHLARVRKLLELGNLHLSTVNEFADGGLHPGYAFPLWHAFLALVAKVAFADPAEVVLHEPTVLAPLAVLVAYEAGYAIFRRACPAAASAGAAVAIAVDGAGARRRLHGARPAGDGVAPDPRPRRARARAGGDARAEPRPARERRARLARARGRPSDVRDLPLDPVRRLPRRALGMAARAACAAARSRSAALVVPAGLFLVWLLPVVRSTASVSPGADERARGFDAVRGSAERLAPTASRSRRRCSAAPAPSRSRRCCWSR